MYPLWIATIFIAMVSIYAVNEIPRREAEAAYLIADVSAINFLSYRQAVSKYLDDNPAATGVIDDAALATYWQPGYLRDPRWTNLVDGTALYVHSTAIVPQDTVFQVYKRTDESLLVGIKNSGTGRLHTPIGFDTGINLPGSIPDNSIVMIGR